MRAVEYQLNFTTLSQYYAKIWQVASIEKLGMTIAILSKSW